MSKPPTPVNIIIIQSPISSTYVYQHKEKKKKNFNRSHIFFFFFPDMYAENSSFLRLEKEALTRLSAFPGKMNTPERKKRAKLKGKKPERNSLQTFFQLLSVLILKAEFQKSQFLFGGLLMFEIDYHFKLYRNFEERHIVISRINAAAFTCLKVKLWAYAALTLFFFCTKVNIYLHIKIHKIELDIPSPRICPSMHNLLR